MARVTIQHRGYLSRNIVIISCDIGLFCVDDSFSAATAVC